jgi:hypothetical protein
MKLYNIFMFPFAAPSGGASDGVADNPKYRKWTVVNSLQNYRSVRESETMKRILQVPVAVLILGLILSGCGSQGPGPRVWIDWPLEENNPVQVEPIIIQAHTSDLEGVASLEFAVDGREVNSSDLNGDRMDYAIFEWTPPGPGIYTVSVRGMDNAGNTGAPAKVSVVVIAEEEQAAADLSPQLEMEEPELETEAEEPATGAELPSPPEEPSSPQGTLTKNSNCRSGTDTVFEIVAILLQGQTVPIVGKSPDQYYLVVAEPEHGRSCWLAANLVDIQGDLGQVSIIQPPTLPVVEEPPEEPPPVEPPSEPPPDTTDPIIVTITLSPSIVTVLGGGCVGDPRTSTSTLTIYEEGGISLVSAAWTLGAIGGTVNYSTSDGSTYNGVFGPVENHGTMNIYGSVVDNAGNWTPFVHTLTVQACIE